MSAQTSGSALDVAASQTGEEQGPVNSGERRSMPRHPASASRAPGDHLDANWMPWTVKVPAGVAIGLAALLGSAGWIVVGFGVGSNCTDRFDCGSDTCAPCASTFSWINAGAIGQWALVAAVIVLLVIGLRQLMLRRAMAIGIWAVIPLSLAWVALSTAMAQRG